MNITLRWAEDCFADALGEEEQENMNQVMTNQIFTIYDRDEDELISFFEWQTF